MNSFLVALLSIFLGGGGSDLLDYVSPAEYWKQKQVAVSVETMMRESDPPPSAEVSGLIDGLNSPDPQVRQASGDRIATAGPGALPALRAAAQSPSPQISISAKGLITRIEAANRPAAVRRLMAIRSLGELKDPRAIGPLEQLLKSDEPFVADYAREALDRIQGRPFQRAHPANLRDDVWLLPERCRAVAQILGPQGGPVSIEQALKDGPLPAEVDRAAMAEVANGKAVQLAEALGNIRLDAISMGGSGDIGMESGFVVIVARGRYDARAVEEFVRRLDVPSNVVAGVRIFQPPGAEIFLMFPSNEYAVMLASPRGTDLPTVEMIDAIRARAGKLRNVPEMKRLIEQSPPDQPVWAVASVTPAYARAAIFAPFKTLELRSRRTGRALETTFTATGGDAEKARAVADTLTQAARRAADAMSRAGAAEPHVKALADAFRTVQCKSSDGNAQLTAQIDAAPDSAALLPIFLGSNRRAMTRPTTQP